MNGDQIANLLYLMLLGSAIAGWFFVQNRDRMGQTLQQAAIWGFIFLGTIAAVGLWSDIRSNVASLQTVTGGGDVSVPRSADGHYYLSLDIDGTPVRFVVDTGASEMVLSTADARRIGIDPTGLDFLGSANTANGIVRTAPVTLDRVALEGIVDRDVRAWVNQGDMRESLLGMGYLNRFARLEFADDRLLLER